MAYKNAKNESNEIFGKEKTNGMIGSGAGALAGAAVGFLFGGPVGAAIGGLVGGAGGGKAAQDQSRRK